MPMSCMKFLVITDIKGESINNFLSYAHESYEISSDYIHQG